ncbi:hypothetical protein AMATHDRAFT_134318 [Amanita thiersii Skay4041]|uniref:Endonuclease/exonuclease/phosphatase domain-containing protein n=1 Tax=Amanita thiersii Skay4041 TaxID=703135 RepID=A0A2A9P1F2_9AGAR|nr:hypothetical protein AMATHDRAFT_134318 [Amanita thiersii Skay4041]
MPPRHLTPDQIALSEQRKAKRLRLLEQGLTTPTTDTNAGKITERQWISLVDEQMLKRDAVQIVKIMTFNLLAQCLVRRSLFPTSNCLKASQREPMIHREILSQKADIICLQEVDRLQRLVPTLNAAGYAHHYAAGPRKNHGCLIAFNQNKFTKASHHLIHYDDEEIRVDGDGRARQGKTFCTKNIGSLIALKHNTDNNAGIIIATTHLFWHPKLLFFSLIHVLTPISRQVGILFREVIKYRHRLQSEHWPCVIAGDFNFPPNDPAYSLLVGDLLSPEQRESLESSRVVHVSVDPTVPRTINSNPTPPENDETEDAIDPDRVITNARAATIADGLLSDTEFQALFSFPLRPRSVYDIGMREGRNHSKDVIKNFGDRVSLLPGRLGWHEPEYTSYTHYWKTVLDYIFVIDPIGFQGHVTGILSPHRTEDLTPGLPQLGVCGSDHISLAAELCWQPTSLECLMTLDY